MAVKRICDICGTDENVKTVGPHDICFICHNKILIRTIKEVSIMYKIPFHILNAIIDKHINESME